jgi:hypothetical protein
LSTIADRRSFVQLELGNRADISSGTPSRVDNWLWQSYLNIGMSIQFSEMEFTATSQFVQASDTIPFPDDARAIKSLVGYRSDGTALDIQIKDMKYIRRFNSKTQGPPDVIAFYNKIIYVRPIPDAIYDATIDYWQKPQQDPNDLSTTELLVPDDWLEVIDMGAILRGHRSLLERDKAQEIQQLLFGFTVPLTGKMIPGLIAQMMTRRQAQSPMVDYGIEPSQTKRSYTNV